MVKKAVNEVFAFTKQHLSDGPRGESFCNDFNSFLTVVNTGLH